MWGQGAGGRGRGRGRGRGQGCGWDVDVDGMLEIRKGCNILYFNKEWYMLT